MNNFLAKLRPDSKVNIGVSVSPNVGLEMILVDAGQNKVVKYAQRQLGYNNSIREIEDYNEFKRSLQDLFNELNINPAEANVVLNLPSVCFGHTFLPTVLDDEAIRTALTSEIEQNYLFKKNNPSVSWIEVKENNSTGKRYILYSAIQESVLDRIKQIFLDLGATLIAVENTYSSLMKTLEFTELSKDFAMSQGSWNILLVSQNSFAVFSMLGNSIIEYNEEPLAIKSFNNDEVYVAISQAASAVLDKYPTDKLIIISESDEVSAEILAIQLKHPGDVVFLECNQYSKQPIMEVDFNVLPHYVKLITPEAIGAAIYKNKDFAIKLNFLDDKDIKTVDTIDVFGFALTKDQLTLYTCIIAALIWGISFLISTSIGMYLSNLESKRSTLEQEITAQETELANLQRKDGVINIYAAAKDIDKSMVSKVTYFDSIGADIPTKVWLTYFYADTKGAYGIKGQTTSVDDVYLFFRNLKGHLPESDLILSKLSVDDNGGIIDIEKATNAVYTFELTNANFASVKVVDPNQPAANSSDNNANEGSSAGTREQATTVPNLPDLPQ